MASGVLGTNSVQSGSSTIYTVPAGKVAYVTLYITGTIAGDYATAGGAHAKLYLNTTTATLPVKYSGLVLSAGQTVTITATTSGFFYGTVYGIEENA